MSDESDFGSFFVCGYLPPDAAGESISVLGSTNDLCQRTLAMPVVIIKKEPPLKGRTFLVTMGSQPAAAHKAFQLACQVGEVGFHGRKTRTKRIDEVVTAGRSSSRAR